MSAANAAFVVWTWRASAPMTTAPHRGLRVIGDALMGRPLADASCSAASDTVASSASMSAALNSALCSMLSGFSVARLTTDVSKAASSGALGCARSSARSLPPSRRIGHETACPSTISASALDVPVSSSSSIGALGATLGARAYACDLIAP